MSMFVLVLRLKNKTRHICKWILSTFTLGCENSVVQQGLIIMLLLEKISKSRLHAREKDYLRVCNTESSIDHSLFSWLLRQCDRHRHIPPQHRRRQPRYTGSPASGAGTHTAPWRALYTGRGSGTHRGDTAGYTGDRTSAVTHRAGVIEMIVAKGTVFKAVMLHCKDTLGWWQPRPMRWSLVWIMLQVQDWSLYFVTCSPAGYHCATTSHTQGGRGEWIWV